MTAPTYDVVIVGAGIIGASCAWECAQAGLKVALVEAGLPGGGATAANMGQLIVEDGPAPVFELTRYSVQRWYALRPELPSNVEFDPVGSIWIASDEAEMQTLDRQERSYRQRGMAATLLDGTALAKLEPNLRFRPHRRASHA